ncbi:MAG: hypothetical protein SOY39_15230, partial [Lachnospiraceae bacterium]|nr:hypothetical protein [Lachnospiraceae bacterium]
DEKCVSLSLYSVADVGSLCKGLFSSITLNRPKTQNKALIAGKLVAKTLYNGLSSHWGIDINYSEEASREVLSLLNLSKTLVILEDLERTRIPILDLMGFVNSLTEIDNVKVLLIANEHELKSKLGNESDLYAKIKEKTIYDTIELNPVNISGIKGILNSFKDGGKIQATLSNTSLPDEIFSIMCDKKVDCYNLRSLKYALQKSSDLVNLLNFSPDPEFLKHILLSILAFTFKKKKQDNLYWVDDTRSPAELGTEKYPLHKSCYDYLQIKVLDLDSLRKANESFVQWKEYELKQKSLRPYFETIFSFHRMPEKQLEATLQYFISNPMIFKEMPILDRVRFFNYLLAIEEHSICIDSVSKCKPIIQNSFNGEVFEYNPWMYDGIRLETDEAREQWGRFKDYVRDLSNTRADQLFGFDYTIGTLSSVKEAAMRGYYTDNHKFVSLFNLDCFIALIKQCNAAQIDELRSLFLQVYGFENIYDFFMEDLPQLKTLREKLTLLQEDADFDAIQRLQLEYFISNLDLSIDKLESHLPPVPPLKSSCE